MYQLLILSCKLPQVFLALFIFTPVNSFKTHGKIGREGVYIFGVHMSGLQGCHAQEGCGSIQHASICPAMSCRHTTSPMGANMSYQEKKQRHWHQILAVWCSTECRKEAYSGQKGDVWSEEWVV